MPGARVEIEKVAVPAAVSWTEVRTVPPSWKVTVPVGVPPLPMTVEVKVRIVPELMGLPLVVRVVVVVAMVTLMETVTEVLGASSESPEKVAVMVC
jgi:antibiotic biosynthesis monooxygenase (ABM) superfamily enzyme